jgi:hypothetical protein
MNGRRTIAALAAGAALVLVPSLGATPPTEGSGTGTIDSRVVTYSRDADGNVIQVRQTSGTVEGAFDGTYTLVVRGVIHKTGLVTFHGTMVVTGLAGDCGAGTTTLELEGRAVAGVGISEGRLRTIDDAANTVPVHVIGTFEEAATLLTYQGEFHCD